MSCRQVQEISVECQFGARVLRDKRLCCEISAQNVNKWVKNGSLVTIELFLRKWVSRNAFFESKKLRNALLVFFLFSELMSA